MEPHVFQTMLVSCIAESFNASAHNVLLGSVTPASKRSEVCARHDRTFCLSLQCAALLRVSDCVSSCELILIHVNAAAADRRRCLTCGIAVESRSFYA